MKYERWENIPEFRNYQVCNFGNVRRLTNYISNGKGGINLKKGRNLKHSLDGNGYRIVRLSKSGKVKNFKVAVLVAMAFLKHKPNGHKLIVDHIDQNKQNDKLDNLQIITQRQNVSRSIKKGSSKFTGVSWYKANQKWSACIYINGEQKHLGYFNYELQASTEYQNALSKLK